MMKGKKKNLINKWFVCLGSFVARGKKLAWLLHLELRLGIDTLTINAKFGVKLDGLTWCFIVELETF